MISVSVLVFDEVITSSITGVLDLLNGVNRHLQSCGRPAAYAVELVGEHSDRPPVWFANISIPCKSFKDAGHSDLIIVPSFSVGNQGVVSKNRSSVQWIKDRYESGAQVASLCVGSYFLAEAGLLDGREATSHWAVLNEMQKRYPAIRIKSDRVITDQDGLYTSGGAFSSLKLIVYLIEKNCGREIALWTSKMFAIEMDRGNQGYFAMFIGQHQHADEPILMAQSHLEKYFEDDLSMKDLCRLVNMGNRNFIRRFKAATGNTPFEYLQRVRVESAKKSIEQNEKPLETIINNVGYHDLKAFRMVFKRITGLSPQEYKRKYARSLV